MNERRRHWLRGIVIALASMAIYTVALGVFLSLMLLVISIEEGGGALSDLSVSLTLAVVLLSQGIGFTGGSMRLTIVPLLLTFLLIWLICTLTRRISPHWQAYGTGVVVWIVTMWLFSRNVSVTLADPMWRQMLKTAAVFSLGFFWGAIPWRVLWKHAKKFASEHMSSMLSKTIGLCLFNGLLLLGMFTVCGLITVVIWTVLGAHAVVRVFEMSSMQTGSRILTSICAVGWLPNLMAWAVSWLFGSGFSIGDLDTFTLWSGRAVGLPAIPVFGIFPESVANKQLRQLLVSTPMLTAFIVGIVELFMPKGFAVSAGKPQQRGRNLDVVAQFVYPFVSFAATIGLVTVCQYPLFAISSGALGIHRLAHVGVNARNATSVIVKATGVGFLCAWLVAVVMISAVIFIRIIAKYTRDNTQTSEESEQHSQPTGRSLSNESSTEDRLSDQVEPSNESADLNYGSESSPELDAATPDGSVIDGNPSSLQTPQVRSRT
jgi:hypothetical protein